MIKTQRLGAIGKSILAFTLLAAIGACGGGNGSSPSGAFGLPAAAVGPDNPSPGGSSASTTFGPVTPKPGPNTTSLVMPVCTSCPAVSNTQYSGSGTGVWSMTNTTASLEQIPISLSGLTGQTVQLVYSNATSGSADTSMFGALLLPVTAVKHAEVSAKAQTSAAAQAEAAVAEFNSHGYKALLEPRTPGSGGAVSKAAVAPPNSFALNSTHAFYDNSGTVRHTTLVRQGATSDGTIVNVWVEDSENVSGKVTAVIDDALLSNYIRAGGIYDMVTSIGGPLWGPQLIYSNLIPDHQPINLVVINFQNDQTPYGLFGSFNALNNLIPNPITAPTSNGMLMVMLDSETMYLGGTNGMPTMIDAMAHESTHMQNFYRRNILKGPDFGYDVWLNEQTAMMMEDWVSYTLNPAFNNIRDQRAPNYVLEQSSNCSLINFDVTSASCDSYSVNGSFGGFLNRQLGLAFFKDLLYRVDNVNSLTVLDEAIRAANPSTSVADSFTRFSVTLGALVPATKAPPGYTFPARSDSGYTLAAIDPAAYTKQLPATPVTAVTGPINPFAAIPVTRASGSGTYAEGVPVPPGVTLSVVIY
jgi:hypothetical protein